MHDRTKKSLYRHALLSLRRLHRRFQLMQARGQVSIEAAQCVRDALSCLRRSHDLYRTEARALSATTTKRAPVRKKARR
jgi:hypothetical protein